MNKDKITEFFLISAKVITFISLVMTVVIKTRILLGLKNPSEEYKTEKSETDEKEVSNDIKN